MIIFGTGDCASLANYYIKHDTARRVDAFCVDGAFVRESHFEGVPVMAFEDLPPPSETMLFIPLYDNVLRAKKYHEAEARGYDFYSYISSRAVCMGRCGRNCFVMEGNVIQPYAVVGNNVILWSGNHVGHHTVVGDHVFVSSHVVISGHVTVGEYSWLGVNACLRDGITLGENCMVGMGSVLTTSADRDSVYYGNPATRRGGRAECD